LTNVLAEANFGVICLTPENQNAPWLLFEAGSLAKTATVARVVPYLYELSPADIRYPLAQFQGVGATKAGTLKLLQSMNEAGQLGMPVDRLEKVFEKWWPDLEAALSAIGPIVHGPLVTRSERELLEEILAVVRTNFRQSTWASEPKPLRRLTIDTSKFFEVGGPISIEYYYDQAVSRFLDAVYVELNEIGHVPAYQYGKEWLLRDQQSGRVYDDIGIEYCRSNGKTTDTRGIGTVGIKSGDRLEVIKISELSASKTANN